MNTGEFIPVKEQQVSYESIRKKIIKSSNQLRRIINQNFTGNYTEKFITLTYSCHMDDYQQVNIDYKKFWSRFKYAYPNCEYVKVIEPQSNGSFHIHVLVKRTNGEKLFVPYEHLKEIWGLGGVWIKNLPFADNFGAYFCAKFKDNKHSDQIDENYMGNAYEKGKRIIFYPTNFRFYSCSKGIQKPVPIIIQYSELKELVGERLPIYSYIKTIQGKDDEGNPIDVNAIKYEQYILKSEDGIE